MESRRKKVVPDPLRKIPQVTKEHEFGNLNELPETINSRDPDEM